MLHFIQRVYVLRTRYNRGLKYPATPSDENNAPLLARGSM